MVEIPLANWGHAQASPALPGAQGGESSFSAVLGAPCQSWGNNASVISGATARPPAQHQAQGAGLHVYGSGNGPVQLGKVKDTTPCDRAAWYISTRNLVALCTSDS